MQRSENYLDSILAASCSKLVEMESTPEQNVCTAGGDKSDQKQDEGRNRRRRLTARARPLRIAKSGERLTLVKTISSDVPSFQDETQRLATADGH
jgi:hypothetical protein